MYFYLIRRKRRFTASVSAAIKRCQTYSRSLLTADSGLPNSPQSKLHQLSGTNIARTSAVTESLKLSIAKGFHHLNKVHKEAEEMPKPNIDKA
ncbi:hypothetical protein S7335_142 [Synechococcus sp. PCC 7335]|nr:hypothetical protein S7335_142 [Synechococcus sp. PCC 7335]